MSTDRDQELQLAIKEGDYIHWEVVLLIMTLLAGLLYWRHARIEKQLRGDIEELRTEIAPLRSNLRVCEDDLEWKERELEEC